MTGDEDEVSHLVPPVTSALADVRRLVQEHCSRLGCGDVEDTLILLTSEVVANAILHGRGPVAVRLRNTGGRIRILVDDLDPTPLQPGSINADDTLAESGRGLLLVKALADSWGHETTDTGKTVWFEPSY